jgi:hypothetical protein
MKRRFLHATQLNCTRLLLLGLLAVGYALAAHAQVAGKKFVTDCTQYGPGHGTLQKALIGGGTVIFKCSGTIVVPNIQITANTKIDATEQNVILSGNNQNVVFFADSAVGLELNHLTIANGNGIYGGAISLNSSGSKLTITNSTLQNNKGGFGGAIFVTFGSALTITKSTLQNNSASFGGAVNSFNCTITVIDSTLSRNSAVFGGAFYSGLDTLTITNSTLSGNSAGYLAGAIYVQSGIINGIKRSLTITNSTLSGNYGGFSGTTGASGGDALYIDNNDSGEVNLINTIIANSPNGDKGENCVFLKGTITTALNDLVDDDSCDLIQATLLADIKLGPLADNGGPTKTHALLSDSVAINAVPKGDCKLPNGKPLLTDQRGVKRPQGRACDVGAFEFGGKPKKCDLDGNNRFDLRDVVKFALGCSTDKATWFCNYTNGRSFTERYSTLFVKECQGGSKENAASLVKKALHE